MGSIHPTMCCGDYHSPSEALAESIQPVDSKSYRANGFHSDSPMENMEQANSRLPEFEEMDRINQLLEIAEKRLNAPMTIDNPASFQQPLSTRTKKKPGNIITKKYL